MIPNVGVELGLLIMLSKHRDSRLLFVHIDHFRALHDVNLRLDPSFDVTYTAGKLSIIYRKEFPSNFYDVGERHSRCVLSIAALIGMNGAGKTSVAQFLEVLAKGCATEAFGVAIVTLENGSLVCSTDIKHLKIESRHNVVLQRFSRGSIEFQDDIYFLYLNPHATVESPFITKHPIIHFIEGQLSNSRNKRFIDASTIGIMEESAAECVENVQIGEFRRTATDLYMDRETADFFRTYTDLSRMARKDRTLWERLSLPKPEQVLIAANESVISAFYTGTQRKGKKRASAKWDFLHVADKLEDAVIEMFVAYVAAYCQDLEEDGAGVVEDYNKYQNDLLAFCRGTITKERVRGKKRINAIHVSIIRFLKEAASKYKAIRSLGATAEVFVCLKDLFGAVGHNSLFCTPSIPLNDDEDADLIQRLIKAYYNARGRYEFLIFSPYPMLSAGEMSYMSLYSRIYLVLTDWKFSDVFDPFEYSLGKRPGRDYRHVVIFMDEAETALHPELQRQLVRNMILFIEAIAKKNLTVQFIFASHSPMLLSDIPQEAVTLLIDGSSTPFDVNSKQLDFHNTFAANIFDLYRNSFNMDEGTLGSFSTEKINYLLKKKSENQPFSKDDTRLVAMVGDNFFRRYLSR